MVTFQTFPKEDPVKKSFFLVLMGMLLLAQTAVAQASFPEKVLSEAFEYDVEMRVSGPYMAVPLGKGLLFGGSMRAEESPDSPSKAILALMDEAGGESWRLEVPADLSTMFSYVTALSDESVVMIQQTERPMTNDKDYFPSSWNIVRAKDGHVLASDPFTPGDEQLVPRLFSASDGYFVFYGERREKDKHGGTFHVPALEMRNNDGSVRWKHVFNKNEIELQDCLQVKDGTIFVGSEEDHSNGKLDQQGIVMKVDHAGNLVWRTVVSAERWKYFMTVEQNSDGNYIALGSHTLKPTKADEYPSRATSACFSPDGDLLWEREKNPGEPMFNISSLIPLKTGFIALASDEDFGSSYSLVYLDNALDLLQEWPVAHHASMMPSIQIREAASGLILIECMREASGQGSTIYVTPILLEAKD